MMPDQTTTQTMNSTDIHERLVDDLDFVRTGGDKRSIYETAPQMTTAGDRYLYRSMTTAEAKQWFTEGWIPTSSGIPWSTNQRYSYDNYFKGDCNVQVEVPAFALLERYRSFGANPKREGGFHDGMDAETWSTGPKSEVGRQAEAEKNDLLFAAYQKDMSTLPSEVQDLSRKKFNNPAKQREVQNMLFTREFKSILMREGRVIARRV